MSEGFKRIVLTEDWAVTADKSQWILEQRRVAEKSGNEYFTNDSYHRTLGDLLSKLLDLEVRSSNVDSLVALSQRIEEIRDELIGAVDGIISDDLSVCL